MARFLIPTVLLAALTILSPMRLLAQTDWVHSGSSITSGWSPSTPTFGGNNNGTAVFNSTSTYSSAQGTTQFTSSTVDASRPITIGGTDSASSRQLTITGGELRALSVIYFDNAFAIGRGASSSYGGTAKVSIYGGDLWTNGYLSILARGTSNAAGTLEINGGQVTANSIVFGSMEATQGTGTLTMNGGVLSTGIIRSQNSVGTNSAINFNGGTWEVGNGTVLHNSAPDTFINGDFTIEASNTAEFDNSMGGSGTLTLTRVNNGNFRFLQDNTLSGEIRIEGLATLRVGNNSAGGSLGTANVVNNFQLEFNRNTSLVVSNDIGGTGLFRQYGDGDIILTGNNSYAGTTEVSSESNLIVGNNGTSGNLGAGNVSIENDSTLTFARSDNILVSNRLFGNGTLIKSSTGDLTLNNSANSVTFVQVAEGKLILDATFDAFITDIDAGAVLEANASLDSRLNVADGGTAQGSFTLIGDLNNEGTLAPGLSAGIITVEGDLNLLATSQLDFEFGETAPSMYDQIDVSQDAFLGGNLNVNTINGFVLEDGMVFEVLTIDGNQSGQFANLGQNDIVDTFGDVFLRIDYFGGDGNDVVLYTTAVPEPASGFLALCLLFVFGAQRMRSR